MAGESALVWDRNHWYHLSKFGFVVSCTAHPSYSLSGPGGEIAVESCFSAN